MDEHGNALVKAQLRARLRTGRDRAEFESARSESLQTDEQGRFEWTLSIAAEPMGNTAWFLRLGRQDLFAESVLPLVLPTNHDLGDVRFEPAAVLVAGRVVDAGGSPVVNAAVMVQSVTMVEGERRSHHVASQRATSDSAGAFEIRGHAPGGTLALSVGSNDHLPAMQEFVPGERDVVVVLADAARVTGRLLLDEGVDPADLSLIVLTPGKRYSWAPDLDGSFEIRGVALGRARLALGGRRWGGPPMELFEFEVTRGDSQDPRLDPIDLRGLLLRTRLRAEDPEGAVIDTLLVQARPEGALHEPNSPRAPVVEGDGGTSRVLSKSGQDGFHEFLHGAPVEVSILADELRAAWCTLAGGEIRLTLESGLGVEVRLLGSEQLPEHVFASVGLNSTPGLPRRVRDRSSPAPGAAYLTLPHPGEWKGWVTLSYFEGQRFDSSTGQELRIEVQDVAEVQRFEIQLDATSIERAAELARRQHGR